MNLQHERIGALCMELRPYRYPKYKSITGSSWFASPVP